MKVCVFGGTGFIGSALTAMLVRQGHDVVVPTRNREQCKQDLIVLPTLDLVQCDVLSPKSMDRIVEGCDVVVNLIGILNEGGRNTFESIHIEFNRKLVDILPRHNVKQIIYVSAINAASGAPSKYLRSKGKGEVTVKSVGGKVDWTIIRPSVVFGSGDSFTTLFARLVSLFPVMLLPCPNAKFQPIWVQDLVRLICLSIGNREFCGTPLSAGGPEALDLEMITVMIAKALGKSPLVIPLGTGSSYLLAKMAEMMPFVDMLSTDNCDSMSVPNVCTDGNAAAWLDGSLMSLESELRLRLGRTSTSQEHLSEIRHTARR